MVMKPVDGGRAVIGLIECPRCGQDHFTTQIRCGELSVFCCSGDIPNSDPPQNIEQKVDVIRIL